MLAFSITRKSLIIKGQVSLILKKHYKILRRNKKIKESVLNFSKFKMNKFVLKDSDSINGRERKTLRLS